MHVARKWQPLTALMSHTHQKLTTLEVPAEIILKLLNKEKTGQVFNSRGENEFFKNTFLLVRKEEWILQRGILRILQSNTNLNGVN